MSTLSTINFDVDILARSSIVHREDYAASGTDTFALFRREKIISASGTDLLVPIISGSSFRGVLRRIGEQLTANILNYEDCLPVPAAHLLSNGGRLAKSKTPLTDEQERRLKDLIPLIAVFGGAASGRIMSGSLSVGKVLPEIAELAHILPRSPHGEPRPAALTIAAESTSHLADHRVSNSQPPQHDTDDKTSPLGRFAVETMPAGTRLQSWVRITDATAAQVSFLTDVLSSFAEHGHLGGRIGAGHGRITATITPTVLRGPELSLEKSKTLADWAAELAVAVSIGALQSLKNRADWAAELADRRDEALQALTNLT